MAAWGWQFHLAGKAAATSGWHKVNRVLREAGGHLLSPGLDEVPMVFKANHQVMAAQTDLVAVLGQFDPKLVKLDSSGERPRLDTEMT